MKPAAQGRRSKGVWGTGWAKGAGLAMALAATTSIAGCTDANDAIVILQAQVPVVGTDGVCRTSDEGAGAERLSEGVLDVGLDQAYGYDLYPLLANNLPPIGVSGIEPNRISVTGVEMEVLPPPGLAIAWPAGCGPTFEDPAAAVIPPGERRALKVSAVRACHAALVRDLFKQGKLNPSLAERIKFRVIARAIGHHGGTDIKSGPFEFPIRVCHGCLQTGFDGQYAAFSFSPLQPTYIACDNLTENPYKGNVCNPAQDSGPILCCAQDAKAEKLLCPAVPGARPASTMTAP
jgi:hypothetical protein